MNGLRLIDLPLPVLHALADRDVATAEDLIGVPIPDEFAGHLDIWLFMITLLTGRPENSGWTMNALVLNDVIIGNAGFKGAPDQHGEVEVGYGILTDHRGRGHAVAAVALLLDLAAGDPRVSSVRATIRPDNTASLAVITRAGFTPAGDRIHERWGRQLVFCHPALHVAN